MNNPDASSMYEAWVHQFGTVFKIPAPMGDTRVILTDPKAIAHFYSVETWTYVQTRLSRVAIENLVRALPSGDTGRRHGARGRAEHHVTCLRVRIWVKRGERCWERYWGEERAVMPGRGLWGSVGRWREKEEGGKDARFVGVRKGGARLMGRGRAG